MQSDLKIIGVPNKQSLGVATITKGDQAEFSETDLWPMWQPCNIEDDGLSA